MGFMRRIKHVQTKILAGFAVMALVVLAVGVLAVVRMSSLHDDTTVLVTEDLRAIQALGETRTALHAAALGIVLALIDTSPQGRVTSQQGAEQAAARIRDNLAIYRRTDPVETADVLRRFEPRMQGYLETLTDRVIPAMASGTVGAVFASSGEDPRILFNQLDSDMAEMLRLEVEGSQVTFRQADADYESGRLLTIVAIAVAVALAVGLGLFIARSIARPLGETADALDRVAEGDLTVNVANDLADETGRLSQALNRMVERMSETVGAIAAAATRLSSASDRLTAVSSDLTATAEQASGQATSASAVSEQVSANVNTVAAGAEEMGASIREIAGTASQAADVAASAAVLAAETDTTARKLGDSSAEIGDVVAVITSIAEQTNLLALNATIEAARAGEAGKGFAVVAGEVKDLAGETAKATGDIRSRIAALQGDAGAVAGAIAQITGVIGEITEFQGTIAAAVEEQTVTTNEIARNVAEAATGTSGIVTSISTVAVASNQTSAGATNILDAAADLARQAEDLNSLVTQFNVQHTTAAPVPVSTA